MPELNGHMCSIKMDDAELNTHREIVNINVGGVIFQCFRQTLTAFPDSKLANLEKFCQACINDNTYFFDRNPALFAYILDGYRKGKIHLPKDVCGLTLKDELQFWALSPRFVSPCCWEILYKGDDEVITMETLIESLRTHRPTPAAEQAKQDIQTKMWQFLDEPQSSKPAMIWCFLISTLIVAAAFMEALATLSTFQVEYEESEKEVLRKLTEISGWDNSSMRKLMHMKPTPALQYGNFACHCILTLEFFIGFIVCPEKAKYVKNPLRIIVLIGYVSYWVDIALELNFERMTSVYLLRVYLALRYMTILMLARLFYITNQIPAFQLIGLTFRFSKQELTILGFVLGILVSVFGFIMFVSELFHNPDMENVFSSMYWALITLTTVGYGRYVPKTTFGHIVAGACAVCGVIVLALPIGIMASTFYTFYSYNNYAKKHIRACGGLRN